MKKQNTKQQVQQCSQDKQHIGQEIVRSKVLSKLQARRLAKNIHPLQINSPLDVINHKYDILDIADVYDHRNLMNLQEEQIAKALVNKANVQKPSYQLLEEFSNEPNELNIDNDDPFHIDSFLSPFKSSTPKPARNPTTTITCFYEDKLSEASRKLGFLKKKILDKQMEQVDISSSYQSQKQLKAQELISESYKLNENGKIIFQPSSYFNYKVNRNYLQRPNLLSKKTIPQAENTYKQNTKTVKSNSNYHIPIRDIQNSSVSPVRNTNRSVNSCDFINRQRSKQLSPIRMIPGSVCNSKYSTDILIDESQLKQPSISQFPSTPIEAAQKVLDILDRQINSRSVSVASGSSKTTQEQRSQNNSIFLLPIKNKGNYPSFSVSPTSFKSKYKDPKGTQVSPRKDKKNIEYIHFQDSTNDIKSVESVPRYNSIQTRGDYTQRTYGSRVLSSQKSYTSTINTIHDETNNSNNMIDFSNQLTQLISTFEITHSTASLHEFYCKLIDLMKIELQNVELSIQTFRQSDCKNVDSQSNSTLTQIQQSSQYFEQLSSHKIALQNKLDALEKINDIIVSCNEIENDKEEQMQKQQLCSEVEQFKALKSVFSTLRHYQCESQQTANTVIKLKEERQLELVDLLRKDGDLKTIQKEFNLSKKYSTPLKKRALSSSNGHNLSNKNASNKIINFQ